MWSHKETFLCIINRNLAPSLLFTPHPLKSHPFLPAAATTLALALGLAPFSGYSFSKPPIILLPEHNHVKTSFFNSPHPGLSTLLRATHLFSKLQFLLAAHTRLALRLNLFTLLLLLTPRPHHYWIPLLPNPVGPATGSSLSHEAFPKLLYCWLSTHTAEFILNGKSHA